MGRRKACCAHGSAHGFVPRVRRVPWRRAGRGGRVAARAARRPARGARSPRAHGPVRADRPSPAGAGPVPAAPPSAKRRAGGRAGPRDSRALPAAAGADAGRAGGGWQPPAPADLVRRPGARAGGHRAPAGARPARDAHRPRGLRQDAVGARGRRRRGGEAARWRLVRRPGEPQRPRARGAGGGAGRRSADPRISLGPGGAGGAPGHA